jgi:hypothetical protein
MGGQKIYSSIKQLAVFNQLIQNNRLKTYFLIFIFLVILLIILIFLYLNSLWIEHDTEDVREIVIIFK